VGSGKREVGREKWEVRSRKWEVGREKWEERSGKWEVTIMYLDYFFKLFI
jgi:hypothetical protein